MRFNKKYFEDRKFSRGSKDNFYNDAYLNWILTFKKYGKLLELGCSFGFFLKKAEKYFETYGVDISDYAIKQARENTRTSKLFKLNIEKNLDKKFKSNYFDIIIAIDIFEHLKDPKKTAQIIFNLLNKKGIMIIKIPNKESIFLSILKYLKKEEKWTGYQDLSHYSILELEKWIDIFEEIGFKTKIIASPPTNILKYLFKNRPYLFFNKLNPIRLNETITVICFKNEN